MFSEFQRKKFICSLVYSWPVAVLLAIVLGALGFSTVKAYLLSRQEAGEVAKIEKEIKDIKRKKEGLKSKIADLETEAGFEKAVRDRFYIKKPGEELLVIVEKEYVQEGGEEQKGKNLLIRGFDGLKNFFGI